MILAATGHRPDKLGGYDDALLERLTQLAGRALDRMAPEHVISGMALGWDTAVALACVRNHVPWTAAVPFAGQQRRWPKESQDRYDMLIRAAREVVVVSESYSVGVSVAMQRRNEWMVDHGTDMLALHDGSWGGTFNCLAYARKLGRPVFNLWDEWELVG